MNDTAETISDDAGTQSPDTAPGESPTDEDRTDEAQTDEGKTGDVQTIDGLDVEEIVELPSGRTAVVHQILGKHMRRAQKIMQKHDAMMGNFEVLSQVVLLEGEQLGSREWDEEPWGDIQTLIDSVFPEGGPAQNAPVM
jgi:hypothetical protein